MSSYLKSDWGRNKLNLYFHVYKFEKGSECAFTFNYYPEYPRKPIIGNAEVEIGEQGRRVRFVTEQSLIIEDRDKEYILNTVLRNLDL